MPHCTIPLWRPQKGKGWQPGLSLSGDTLQVVSVPLFSRLQLGDHSPSHWWEKGRGPISLKLYCSHNCSDRPEPAVHGAPPHLGVSPSCYTEERQTIFPIPILMSESASRTFSGWAPLPPPMFSTAGLGQTEGSLQPQLVACSPGPALAPPLRGCPPSLLPQALFLASRSRAARRGCRGGIW